MPLIVKNPVLRRNIQGNGSNILPVLLFYRQTVGDWEKKKTNSFWVLQPLFLELHTSPSEPAVWCVGEGSTRRVLLTPCCLHLSPSPPFHALQGPDQPTPTRGDSADCHGELDQISCKTPFQSHYSRMIGSQSPRAVPVTALAWLILVPKGSM